MLVVADASALLSLAACVGLALLDRLFEKVRVPPAVFGECTGRGKPGAEVLERYLHDKDEGVNLGEFAIAAGELGRGELEAMALYKRLGADRLLVNDLGSAHETERKSYAKPK
jgi:uncharacterized protein